MEKITIEHRIVHRTGTANLGFKLGYGQVKQKITIKKKVWCVLSNGKVILECRNRYIARRIASLLRQNNLKKQEKIENKKTIQKVVKILEGK